MYKDPVQPKINKHFLKKDTTKSDYMPIRWKTWGKWTNLRKLQPSKTEPGRNRNYEQTNHK